MTTRRPAAAIAILAAPLALWIAAQGCGTSGPSAGETARDRFTLLWRHEGAWEEHQTVKDGKVFCPMYQENPPNLTVVDLFTGRIEHTIELHHRCCCAPWFAHGKAYLFAIEYDFARPCVGVDLRPTVYVIDLRRWQIEHMWPVEMFADVEVSNYHAGTDRFYLPSGAYDASTGTQAWNLGRAFMKQAGALIVEDTVYYHTPKSLEARRIGDGSLMWSLPLGEDDNNKYNTPIYDSDHGLIYIGTDTKPWDDDIDLPQWRRSGTVYAIDPSSRSTLWKRRFENGSIKSTLTYHRGRLFVPVYNKPQGTRLALHWRDGTTLWEHAVEGDDGWATSAVDDRYLYTASHGRGGFIVQDQQTGEVVWQVDAGAGICCSPIISGGVVVVGTSTDFLAVRIGKGTPVDAPWRGNPHFTGYTPGGVDMPEEEKAAWPD